jgi:hypothetical protein
MATFGNYKYPYNVAGGDGEYKHRITFTAQKYNSGSDTRSTEGTASLYMPGEALKTSYGQSFGDAELGALGNLVSGMDSTTAKNAAAAISTGSIADLANIEKTLKSAVGPGFKDRVSTALKESTAKSVRDKVASSFPGASAALQNVLGQVRNPHKAIVYSGPGGFRSFSYTFVMTPESAAESKEIANIVYFFKWHMHPGVTLVGGTAAVAKTTTTKAQPATQGSSTFTYPNEWKIELNANGLPVKEKFTDKKPALFRINNCFLESLTTDFTTSGQPAFFQGSGDAVPVTTTLNLTFKETILVTRESIEEGY